MDKKLTEHRFPSDEVISTYNKINETEETFMESLKDPDKAIAVSSSVLSLEKAGVPNVTAEQLELENGKISYKITTDPSGLTEEELKDLVDVTDRFQHDLLEDGFILKEED